MELRKKGDSSVSIKRMQGGVCGADLTKENQRIEELLGLRGGKAEGG